MKMFEPGHVKETTRLIKTSTNYLVATLVAVAFAWTAATSDMPLWAGLLLVLAVVTGTATLVTRARAIRHTTDPQYASDQAGKLAESRDLFAWAGYYPSDEQLTRVITRAEWTLRLVTMGTPALKAAVVCFATVIIGLFLDFGSIALLVCGFLYLFFAIAVMLRFAFAAVGMEDMEEPLEAVRVQFRETNLL